MNRCTNNMCGNIFVKWDRPVTIIAIVTTMSCQCSFNSPPRWTGIQLMGWIPLGGMWLRTVWRIGVALFGCWISAIPVLLWKCLLLTTIDTSLTVGASRTWPLVIGLPSGTWVLERVQLHAFDQTWTRDTFVQFCCVSQGGLCYRIHIPVCISTG